nr:uncharacterized protein LOC109191663 isoform X2 [Ipomoea trifida]
MGRSARPLVGFGLLVLCFMAAMAEGEYLKYKDPKQPLGARIKDLMKRMSLEEKIGQMTQIERKVASADIMKQYFIGSVLSGGGSVPAPKASVQDWVNMVNEIQKGALSTRLGIPMIYGIDAVHGHNNVYKATIFPHNIGLGVTRQEHYKRVYFLSCSCLDPELVKRIGAATALEVRATGIPYAFAPCIAVCRDPRWGRCYESYSEDHKIVQMMTEIIPGLQGDLPPKSRSVPFVAGKTKVAACAKHFVGDGGTVKGVDESNTVINIKDLFSIHMPAYYDSIKKGVATVMVSYSSVNGEKMHANGNLVTGFLKNKLKFRNTVDPSTQVVFQENPDAGFVKSGGFSYAIVVVGEVAYAEMFGDSANLTIAGTGGAAINNVCGAVKCVVVVVSGRPVVIEPYVAKIDALVAAWLPGTEGQGVADALFGDYGFTGKLARTWFKSVDQLPMNVGDRHYDPLFAFGFGLTTKPVVN